MKNATPRIMQIVKDEIEKLQADSRDGLEEIN
jgi:hypothetical protein